MSGPFGKGMAVETLANIMYSAAKGDAKLPSLRKVCADFPPVLTLSCRDFFSRKLSKGNVKSSDVELMEKIVKVIDKRFLLNKAVLRSPPPSLQDLLKEED